jgi:hypothetical protein
MGQMELRMRLRNNADGWGLLNATIQDYYKKNGDRFVSFFLQSKDEEWGWFYTHFLLERRIVVRYGLGEDRGIPLGGIQMGIGPHYFGPADFWSYENSERFRVGTAIDDIVHNLGLFDEFLRHPDALKRAHGWKY